MIFNKNSNNKNNFSSNNFLDYKKWDVYFIRVQELIFQISKIEPLIYYRKVELLKYALKIKSLITTTNVYQTKNKEEIKNINLIIKQITNKSNMVDIQKEINTLSQNSNKIFIYNEKYNKLVIEVVNIFEKVIYNLSNHEILPKPKKTKQLKFMDEVDEKDKEYFEFVRYLEGN